jgi:hypothetical protein
MKHAAALSKLTTEKKIRRCKKMCSEIAKEKRKFAEMCE